MDEPVLEKPNSLTSIKSILNEYKHLHGIGINRVWVVLGCDGPPYRIANTITDLRKEEFDWFCFLFQN